MNQIKNYVLDTCVLLHDPAALLAFQEHNIYLPLVVIEELDKFKTYEDEKGRNSRAATRLIDELRAKGKLTTGVSIGEGKGKLTVMTQYSGAGQLTTDIKTNDDKILSTACILEHLNPKEENILVTNDINMRVRANIFGLKVEPFGKKKREDKKSQLMKEIILEKPEYALFKRNKAIGKDRIEKYAEEQLEALFDNEYVKLVNKEDPTKFAYAIFIKETFSFQAIRPLNDTIYGITPKNGEQGCAIDALMDPDIDLVTMIGKAGSGKTLIAIAAALELTLNKKMYDKILIARPVQPMGKDLGFLPGTMEEKLNPWMQPVFDNLEFLLENEKKHSTYQSKGRVKKQKGKPAKVVKKPVKEKDAAEGPKKAYDHLIENNIIQVEALTYIRGRSIPRQLILIDEAQNLTPHEVKTIITRAGEGTKIILTGDTEQIDSPYLDEVSNGLAYATSRLKELPITSHVTLFECERSALAEAGTKYL